MSLGLRSAAISSARVTGRAALAGVALLLAWASAPWAAMALAPRSERAAGETVALAPLALPPLARAQASPTLYLAVGGTERGLTGGPRFALLRWRSA